MNIKKRRLNLNREANITAVVFLAPAIIMLLIWFVYPLIQAFLISFQEYNFVNQDESRFIGLTNYINLFRDEEFYKALRNSLLFVIIVVPLQSAISLLLAVAINNKALKGTGFFRTAFYTPYVLSAVAVATVFMYFFVADTFLTNLLSVFGFPNVTWYANVDLAMVFIGILYIWQTVGFYMIYYLSGLQTISGQIYEAAQIDGASKLQTFFFITIPSLRATTFFVVTYGIIQAFQLFDQISIVTSTSGGLGSPAGATSTLLTFFYVNSFENYEMGYGSAIAMVLFAIIMIISVVQKKIVKEN